VNQPVKKKRPHDGLTKSKVIGLNATVQITYEMNVRGSTAFTKLFTGQIVIATEAAIPEFGPIPVRCW